MKMLLILSFAAMLAACENTPGVKCNAQADQAACEATDGVCVWDAEGSRCKRAL